MTLPPVAASAGDARRFVYGTLNDAGFAEEVVETTVLLVSELVTNAVLHASTDVEVRVSAGRGARVEVRDGSETGPIRRRHAAESVTGRGLELVEMLSNAYGVDRTDHGKSVWFTVGTSDEESEHGWSDGGEEVAPAATVELRQLPLVLYEVVREHHEALLREYAIYRLDAAAGEGPGAREISAADRARSSISEGVQDVLGGLFPDAPPAHIDVRVRLSVDEAEAFRPLRAVLDDAERLAAEGVLLTRPALPELRAVRDWYIDEVLGQFDGAPPRPWRPPLALPEESPVRGDAPANVERLVAGTRLVIVGDESNRIVAVSRPAAELLGWAPDDLVGRRLVTIIPPRFHEAHVAGFTRQLVTGRARILGRPTDLPALHRDGHEIPALMTLTRWQEGVRVFFVASIVPA